MESTTDTESTTEEIITAATAAVTPEDIERFKPEEVEGENVADFDGLIIEMPEDLINLYVASELARERMVAAKTVAGHLSLQELYRQIGAAIKPLGKKPTSEEVNNAMNEVLEGIKDLKSVEYDKKDVLIAESFQERLEELLWSNEGFQKLLYADLGGSFFGPLFGSFGMKTYLLPGWKLGTKKVNSGNGCGCAVCTIFGSTGFGW